MLIKYIQSSIDGSAQSPVACIGNLLIYHCISFDGVCFDLVSQLGRVVQLVVTPKWKIQRVNEKDPIDRELVHFFGIEWRTALPIEIVAVLILQTFMYLKKIYYLSFQFFAKRISYLIRQLLNGRLIDLNTFGVLHYKLRRL